MRHRAEPHSRMEDWLKNLPPSGIRAMCSWERFCTFAREPERRKVGGDARVSVDGVLYEVAPDLADESVILWFGLFDENLDQIAALVADAVEAENCLIQLLKKEEASNEFRLRVCGRYGHFPVSTGQPLARTDDGSAGQVMAADLPGEDSLGLAAPGCAPASPSTHFMSAPIPIGDRMAGTVYSTLREDSRLPSPPAIDRLKLVCLFLGKSLQVIQLQKLLNSRYAQFALNQEGHQATSALKDLANQEPIKLAKILAKTFYREMAKAGFGGDHIISAATETV